MLIALSTPGPQFFVYKYHSPIKISPSGETADFGARPQRVQYEPGTSCCARKQGSAQRMLETRPVGHEPAGKGSLWPLMIVTGYNSLNSIEDHESLQI